MLSDRTSLQSDDDGVYIRSRVRVGFCFDRRLVFRGEMEGGD